MTRHNSLIQGTHHDHHHHLLHTNSNAATNWSLTWMNEWIHDLTGSHSDSRDCHLDWTRDRKNLKNPKSLLSCHHDHHPLTPPHSILIPFYLPEYPNRLSGRSGIRFTYICSSLLVTFPLLLMLFSIRVFPTLPWLKKKKILQVSSPCVCLCMLVTRFSFLQIQESVHDDQRKWSDIPDSECFFCSNLCRQEGGCRNWSSSTQMESRKCEEGTPSTF